MQHGSCCPNLEHEVGGRLSPCLWSIMVPLSEIGISCRSLFWSDVCTCLLIVMENLNSRTLVEWETIGRATVHSIGRVIGVSPFSAATHPHNECCRGMAWVGCLGGQVFGALDLEGGPVVRPLSLPPWACWSCGIGAPLCFCWPGRDGFRQEVLSVGIKMYTSCHWLASLLVACQV